MSNLTRLYLSGNQLTGTIPTELGNLSNLTVLSLWDNQLSGTIPTELGNLSNLISLWLDQNALRGEIPASFTGLASLEALTFISNAGLCAPVDNAFQTWLQGIDNFHGSSCAPVDSQEDRAVLASLYSATGGANWENNSNWLSNRPFREWYGVANDASGRVIGLYLFGNQLTGSIPPELGDLSNLTWLSLGDNQLTGTIPSELGNLSNLAGLFLRENQLTGCIPDALRDVEFNDFDRVGLQFCAPQSPGAPTVSTATRSFSTPVVAAGGQLAVTIEANNYGNYGGVVETLPSGFSYVSSSLPVDSVVVMGQEVRLILLGESNFTYTVTASNTAGSYSFSGVLKDSNGIDYQVAGPSIIIVGDAPGVAVSHVTPGAIPQVRINSPIPLTATFSEPVFGFAVGDITVTNGLAGNFVGSDGDSIYTFDVTPNAIGVVAVDIAADVALDADSKGNIAAIQLSLDIPYDDDHDGAISRDEVITAIGDYLFSGTLTRDQVIALIGLYLFG